MSWTSTAAWRRMYVCRYLWISISQTFMYARINATLLYKSITYSETCSKEVPSDSAAVGLLAYSRSCGSRSSRDDVSNPLWSTTQKLDAASASDKPWVIIAARELQSNCVSVACELHVNWVLIAGLGKLHTPEFRADRKTEIAWPEVHFIVIWLAAKPPYNNNKTTSGWISEIKQ